MLDYENQVNSQCYQTPIIEIETRLHTLVVFTQEYSIIFTIRIIFIRNYSFTEVLYNIRT